MSDWQLDLDPAAIDRLAAQTAHVIDKAAAAVAAQARANVAGHYPGSHRANAIVAVTGQSDEQGPYADVGYARNHPGFVLFWSEVGTANMSPRPHLRQALTQVRI